jgi:hypothetical protein
MYSSGRERLREGTEIPQLHENLLNFSNCEITNDFCVLEMRGIESRWERKKKEAFE